jgi:hypothetical protein
MSRLVGPLFEGSPLLLLPLVALAIFAAVFVAVVARLVLLGSRPFQARAEAPLEGERILERIP